jgi:hypothetical protein
MAFMNMAVTLSPELQRKMKQNQKCKSKDLSASNDRNENRNQVRAFRDLLVRGIN